MAKQRSRPTRRRDKKGGPGSGRRKSCGYCRDKVDQVDYKDVATLRKYVSDRGTELLDCLATVRGLSDQRHVRLHTDQSGDTFAHERMVECSASTE